MALSTYTELKTSVANWLNRADLTSEIPDFIALAEAEMNRTLRVREMEVRAVTSPGADEPYENLPGDFLELKSITFHSDPVRVPELVTPEWIRQYRRKTGTLTGTPSFYAIEGSQILFEKTPDTTQLEINYIQRIPALSDAQTTNWVLTSHPDIYLYGALVQSAPFLKDDDRIAVFDALYKRAIAQLNKTDARSKFPTGAMAARMRRTIG